MKTARSTNHSSSPGISDSKHVSDSHYRIVLISSFMLGFTTSSKFLSVDRSWSITIDQKINTVQLMVIMDKISYNTHFLCFLPSDQLPERLLSNLMLIINTRYKTLTVRTKTQSWVSGARVLFPTSPSGHTTQDRHELLYRHL